MWHGAGCVCSLIPRGGAASTGSIWQRTASRDELRDPGGAFTWDNRAHQQQDPECGFGVYPRALHRALHGAELAFELLLLGDEITRGGSKQLQAPTRSKERVCAYIDEVEQTPFYDGDALVPDVPASVVEGCPQPTPGQRPEFDLRRLPGDTLQIVLRK